MEFDFEPIRTAYRAEEARAASRTLESADELPISYEEITPAWLTKILGGQAPGAVVTGVRLGPADEGTSSRRRIFLEWNDIGRLAGAPASIFCKGTLSLESRYLLAANGGIEAEASFYSRVRKTLPIEAPDAYFSRFDPVSFNSLIVMRDLGQEARFFTHEDSLTRALAESQVRLLATLHGRYFRSAELDTTLAPWRTWEYFFTATVELAGFGPACARGFVEAEPVIPARLFARAGEVWPATLACVDDHRRQPRSLIHSDVHLKNWYVAASGEMGLNDWQCSSKGHWGRDLAYALSTSLSIENRRRWEQDLLRYYFDRLHAAGGPRVAFDDGWRIYRQQLFAALAWWTGTLGQPPEAPKMQPPATSIEFIKRMAHAIDDLDALDSF